MGKREASTVRTAKRRLAGQVSTGPTGVAAQSWVAINLLASPPPVKRSTAALLVGLPDGRSGATHTSNRFTCTNASPYRAAAVPGGTDRGDRPTGKSTCAAPFTCHGGPGTGGAAVRCGVGWEQPRRESPGGNPR